MENDSTDVCCTNSAAVALNRFIVNAVEKAHPRFFIGGPSARRCAAHVPLLTMNSSAKAALRLSAAFYAAVLKRSSRTSFQLLRLYDAGVLPGYHGFPVTQNRQFENALLYTRGKKCADFSDYIALGVGK